MHRIKSTFKRSSSTKDSILEHRRSEAFIKKLEESKRLEPEEPNKNLTDPPTLALSDLSKHEIDAYQALWKDLDPFGIGKADNHAVFQFVSGCGLSDATLKKILSLYQDEKDGLTREEFFAILRLIAHAQHGRTVNRDIVFLGAPLPTFQTQAIDALINRSIPETMRPYDGGRIVPNLSLQATPVRPTILPLERSVTFDNHHINTLSNTPTTTNIQRHSRSKSVPFNFQFTTDVVNQADENVRSPGLNQFDTTNRSKIKPKYQRSRYDSLDAESLQNVQGTGQSLLLTQSFKPDFNMDGDETSNNNQSTSNDSSSDSSNNSFNYHSPYLTNPFETDGSSETTPRLKNTATPPPEKSSSLCHHLANSFYNVEHIPPPPVPPQSTKPAYPKYARRRV